MNSLQESAHVYHQQIVSDDLHGFIFIQGSMEVPFGEERHITSLWEVVQDLLGVLD